MKPSRSRNGATNHLLNLNRREFTLCGVLTHAAWVPNGDSATCGRCLRKLESCADPYASGGRLAFAAESRRKRWKCATGERR